MRNIHGTIYVGIDVLKDKLAVAIARGERARFLMPQQSRLADVGAVKRSSRPISPSPAQIVSAAAAIFHSVPIPARPWRLARLPPTARMTRRAIEQAEFIDRASRIRLMVEGDVEGAARSLGYSFCRFSENSPTCAVEISAARPEEPIN